jgi:hypothetical protein
MGEHDGRRQCEERLHLLADDGGESFSKVLCLLCLRYADWQHDKVETGVNLFLRHGLHPVIWQRARRESRRRNGTARADRTWHRRLSLLMARRREAVEPSSR